LLASKLQFLSLDVEDALQDVYESSEAAKEALADLNTMALNSVSFDSQATETA